ncbi:MAG: BamA/TamA family outer membrane protein [Bacteroidales bacterium]|nr:BamA/TamA family outer membrane protein [Bacteroidales bacterium]
MKVFKVILLSLVIIGFASCAVRKYVPEGKAILVEYKIVNDTSRQNLPSYDLKKYEIPKYDITKSEISNYIIQRPNKTFLGWMPRVWIYYKTQYKTKKFSKWINRNLGVEPVYYNHALTTDSKKLVENYLDNTGFFKSKVVTEKTENKRKRAKVVYKVIKTEPYTIRNIDYKIYDSAIYSEIKKIEDDLLVKTGDNYNVYTMDKDRDLIMNHLRDNGYYFFTKEYIVYEVDTNLRQRKADVRLRIDGKKHDKYYINKVFVYPNHKPKLANVTVNDTIPFTFSLRKNGPKYTTHFVHGKKPKINPKTFNQVIQIHEGDEFSQKKVSQTYRALGSLKIYSLSNITFDTVRSSNDTMKLLNCTIKLQKGKLHHYNIQIEGTNSGGDLGALGSISYRNNNIFRGSEVFRVTIRGGVQAQKVSDVVVDEGIFNTKEFGIDASILFPRFLSPISLHRFVIEYQPKTLLSTGYNVQIRPLYARHIVTTSFGYNWKATNTIEHYLTPINLNIVKLLPTELFEFLLDFETNQRIKDQYTDHLIFGLSYSFIFNNQNVNKNHDFVYFKADIETSGNALSLFSSTPVITKTDKYHEIIGIRYAQYFRYQLDFRFYHYFRNENVLALRMMYGQGLAYGNSNDMPFEKSFYAGGTNGMRGWQFRTLGPGEFKNTDDYDIEHIGDIQLESNIEFRHPLYGILKGAIFCDMGNIWTMSDNSSFEGGQFKFDKFYKQIAIDAGFGVRFDFSFFLIRLDIAAPIHDPAYDEPERWRISSLRWSDAVWNFGIGYPF